jgi:hypothetical protein
MDKTEVIIGGVILPVKSISSLLNLRRPQEVPDDESLKFSEPDRRKTVRS